MSTIVRDLRDDEEDGEEGEGEGEGEESEDEDYVPNPASEDESDADDDDAYDEDVAEVGGAAASHGKAAKKGGKRAGVKRSNAKPKANRLKRARTGGILDEEDDGAATSAPAAEVEADAAATAESAAAESAAAAPAGAAPAPAPSRADELWAELQGGGSSGAPKSKPPAAAGGGLDIKALLAKTSGTSSAHTKDSRLVEIRETVDFCGEEVHARDASVRCERAMRACDASAVRARCERAMRARYTAMHASERKDARPACTASARECPARPHARPARSS